MSRYEPSDIALLTLLTTSHCQITCDSPNSHKEEVEEEVEE